MIDDALGGEEGGEDEVEADTEKSADEDANLSKGHGDGSGSAAATSEGGAVTSNPLANRADALEDI